MPVRFLIGAFLFYLLLPEAECFSPPPVECAGYIRISGQTNVNTFELGYQFEKDERESGKFRIGAEVDKSRLVIPVKAFRGGSARLEEDFYALLQAENHPYIVIDLGEARPQAGQGETQSIPVRISLAGFTRRYEIPCDISGNAGNSVCISGSRHIPLADFKIEAPTRFLGMVKVEQQIYVKFSVNFTLNSFSENQ